MTDQPDNPFASPLGASEGEARPTSSRRQSTISPVSRGMVGSIFIGMFLGAIFFAIALGFTTGVFLFFVAITEDPYVYPNGIEFMLGGAITAAFYGFLVGMICGGLHGIAWYIVRHQLNFFVPIVLLGCVISVVIVEAPQALLLNWDQSLAVFIWFGIQSIGIFIAVYLLNTTIRNYLQS
ncbi:MAG: hypothetical protein COA78_21490 [Blastopirellula sp.]|nr:MAG: hypothetical protein COA78_21490 [Blastopirellula sp.]